MAKIEFQGIDEYAAKLSRLGQASEGICKFAVYDAAGIVCDAIKANAPVNSGDLRDSISLSKFKDDDGFVYTEVVFPGYDSKGTPNLIKARVLESGSSTRQKHPFIRPAVNRVKSAAEASIERNLDKKINEIMNQKG